MVQGSIRLEYLLFWVCRDRTACGNLGLCSFHRHGNAEGLGHACLGELRAPDSQKDGVAKENSKVLWGFQFVTLLV